MEEKKYICREDICDLEGICDNEKEKLIYPEKIDFESIDINLCTDHELSVLGKAFNEIKTQNQTNPFTIELNHRLSKIKHWLYKEEGLDKIKNYNKEVDRNIYYHVTFKSVLETGIDLGTGGYTEIGVYEKHCVNISPGYIYIMKSSKEGLILAIDGASQTGRIVVKLVIPEENVFLDADQIRFQEDLWFQDASFEEASKYFDEDPEFKEMIEESPYRATNKRIDKNQIVGVLYDSNLIKNSI